MGGCGSWLNLIERWFREITDKHIRRGTFRSVPQLIEAIMAYLARHNATPKPFTWTAQADAILATVARQGQARQSTICVRH